MNWDAIGAIAETLSAIGVIASLLYLARQIRSERDATIASNRQQRLLSSRDTLMRLADSPYLPTLLARDKMQPAVITRMVETFGYMPEEAVRLTNHLWAGMMQSEFNLQVAECEEERRITLERLKYLMTNDSRRLFWICVKPMFRQEFVTEVDKLVAELEREAGQS